MAVYFFIFSLVSCVVLDPVDPDTDYFVASYLVDILPVSDLFLGPEDYGVLDNPEIDEASGMVISRQDASLFWTHNDSGDENRIFLVGSDATWRATFQLEGAQNRDWEDISFGPGPDPSLHYLYVGEIGDNNARYTYKHIYRFPEPNVENANYQTEPIPVTNVETITFVYPDNSMMDAETLMVDPWNGDIYIVTKREMPVTVYRLPFPHSTTDTLVAEIYGKLPFFSAVAGDISPDGREILIKTYDKVFLWSREEGESMRDAFLRPPNRLLYVPEPQGEAIAFAIDGSGYYTLSEIRHGVEPRVYFYRRKP